jgi:peroxiredoxin
MLQAERNRSRTVSRHGTALMRVFVTIIVGMLSMPCVAWGASLRLDEPAPDFALKNFAGENLRLSEYRGEVVLVNFWSTSCGKCRDQLSVVDDLFAAHQAHGLQVLSISTDHDAADARQSAEDLNLQIPIVFDSEHVVSRIYDLGTLPLTVLIDHHGTVRQVYKGYRRGDEELYRAELEKLLAE